MWITSKEKTIIKEDGEGHSARKSSESMPQHSKISNPNTETILIVSCYEHSTEVLTPELHVIITRSTP